MALRRKTASWLTAFSAVLCTVSRPDLGQHNGRCVRVAGLDSGVLVLIAAAGISRDRHYLIVGVEFAGNRDFLDAIHGLPQS